MKIETIVVSPFAQNARILICETSKSAILIDPGDEANKILAAIQRLQVKIEFILATHGHIDHIAGVVDVQKSLPVPFLMHSADTFLFQRIPEYAHIFGMPNAKIPRVSQFLQDGEKIKFGNLEGTAILTPGHSPGSLCYLFGDDLISGDVLFHMGVGRTDLPGGSSQVLEESIRKRLYTLPEHVRVHPGHGDSTTIGEEKQKNPFITA